MGFFSNRRNKIVESYLQSMVRSGNLEADVPNLYFEAACRYAQDHGGKLYPDMQNSIIFDKEIGGDNYSVFFFMGKGRNGVNITLTKRRSSYEIAKENAEEFVRKAVKNSRPQPDRAVQAVRERVLEGLGKGNLVRFRSPVKKDIKDFFDYYATNIPGKCEFNEAELFQIGVVDLPDAGLLIVFACIVMEEATINVKSLPTAPGCSQMNFLSTKRAEIQEFQEDVFLGLRSVMQAEIEEKLAATISRGDTEARTCEGEDIPYSEDDFSGYNPNDFDTFDHTGYVKLKK